MNTALLLQMAAAEVPDRPAVTAGGETLTFEEVQSGAQAVAYWLRATDAKSLCYVGVGDVSLPVALMGAAWAGVPFAPLNYRLASGQLEELISSQPDAALVSETPSAVVGKGRTLAAAELLALPAPDEEIAIASRPSDVAFVLFTSGTSGRPKAALLRHEHIVSYILGTVAFHAATSDEVALIAVPPYHIAAIAGLLSNMYACRRVLYLGKFDAKEWVRVAQEQSVTQAMVVPTMLARIVDHLETTGVSVPPIRTISYGGARTPVTVIERALRLFADTDFVNAYGLTETSSTIALLGPQDHRRALEENDPVVQARLASVGQVIPGVEIEIRDERGAPVPEGTTGLVFLRGPQVSGEYQGSSVGESDGWLATGDRGHLDSEGYLYIEGRADDTIIRGGENVDPLEVEGALLQHHAVREACVVGVSDDEWGQRIEAVIVCSPNEHVEEEEVVAWCRRQLRSSKTPTRVHFRSFLPMTDTGKVLRRAVRAELEEGR